jgi:hypothetical protein
MRRCTALVAGAGMALLMVGCERASDVTAPEPAAKPALDALHQTTNEQDVPWAFEEQNPCNGDMVTSTGSSHFLFVTTFDDGGGYHLSSRVNSTGTGIGFPSGITYSVKDDFSYSEQTAVPGTSVRQEWDVMILGPRSIDNYIRHMIFKLTINNNGIPTASFDRTFTKCVG